MEELANQIGRYGLLLVFFNVLFEQAGLPIPATPVLVLSGALAATGRMSAPLVLLSAVSASLLADGVWFYLGRRQGRRILKKICRISLNPESCVRQTERLFDRYGLYSITVAKFIPGFSTIAPPLAGAMGVGAVRFALVSSLGAGVWAGAAFSIGWIFHGTIDEALLWLESIGFWGFLLVGSGLFGFIAFKWWQRRRFYRLLRMSKITPAQLRNLLDDGRDALIFDVRTEGGRRADPRRIPGALVLDADDSSALDARLLALPRDRDIILYCT